MSRFSRKKPFPLLYVDDSENDHLLLHSAAENLHAPLQIWSVTTSEAAMNSLEDDSQRGLQGHPRIPALILLDYQLASSTSLDLLCWIRSRSEFDQAPVVMYSGYDDPENILRSYHCGADEFLCKPAHFGGIEEIVSALVRCLSSRPVDLEPLRLLPEHRPITDCALRPTASHVSNRAAPKLLSGSLAGGQPAPSRKPRGGIGQSGRFRIWQRYRSSRREIDD